MNLVAIDTAFENCSVGVAADRREVVLLSETIGRGHAERLFGMVEAAMSDANLTFADIDRIAVTTGPGSFTGVRVGIAAVRGLALVLRCSVVGIGTLAVIAEQARALAGPAAVLAAIDARRGEVYAQLFDRNGKALCPPRADRHEVFAGLIDPQTRLAGSGAVAITETVSGAEDRIVHRESAPDIGALVRLGLAASPSREPPRPLYLRAPDAKPQRPAVSRQ